MSTSPAFDLRHISFAGRPARREDRAGRPLGAVVAGRACADAGRLDGLAREVLLRSGLDPSAYRVRPLSRRLAAGLRALKCRDEAEALSLVRSAPEHNERALEALLIGVTRPFRDEEVFASIRALVVPALAAQPAPVRVWSAGCSTGEELLSVAALLAEAGLLARSFLLGTDCRRSAVSAAARGEVDGAAWPAAFSGLRDRFFEPVPAQAAAPGPPPRARWRLRPALAARISWKQADVTLAAEPGRWDVVLFRNVSIYLAGAAGERAMARLVGALAPGGWLVLGSAERLPPTLGLVPVQRGLYRRRPEGR